MWLFTDSDLLNKIGLWCYSNETKKDSSKKGEKEELSKTEVDLKQHKGIVHP